MYKIDLHKSAYYLVPLITISPLLKFGSYGILLTDVIILFVGFTVLLKKDLTIKSFFFVFLLLFTVGWIGSNLWSYLTFDIKPQLAELNHLYRMMFYLSAFWIGYKSSYSTEEILSGRFTRIVLIVLAVFVILYFLSDSELRLKLMKFYLSKDNLELKKDKFPGLNSNINIYSFIILIISMFCFYFLIHGNRKMFLPFITSSFIMLAGQSRKVMTFYFIFIFLVLVKHYFYDKETRIIKEYRFNANTIILLSIILISIFIAGYMFSKSHTGGRVIASFKILILDETKTEELRKYYGINSDYNMRYSFMNMGLKRISKSPVFGIPMVRNNNLAIDDILYFHKAHNEFIVIWMYYGIIALIGFIYFFFYTIYSNWIKKQYVWAYLYGILIFQTFFDTVFFSYHLCSILFIFVGLNFRTRMQTP